MIVAETMVLVIPVTILDKELRLVDLLVSVIITNIGPVMGEPSPVQF